MKTVALCLLCPLLLSPAPVSSQTFDVDYDAARSHELEPHRRTIPHQGVGEGFNQLRLTLTVSASGDVTRAEAAGEEKIMAFWPDLESEVYAWKFTPFLNNGKAVPVTVEEYLDLVPPEQLPKQHVAPPVLKPGSALRISLQRSGCYGSCPGYQVTVTPQGIVFNGGGFVVAPGKHTAKVDPEAVRALAQRFVKADFYSMKDEYYAGVTDSPTYLLSLSIDGHSKKVLDYVGEWVGMPAILSELEEAVDKLAQTDRWIAGKDGLVDALKDEGFDFTTAAAQTILKEAASRGEAATVKELLAAGVPLTPVSSPKSKRRSTEPSFPEQGLLASAATHADVLQVLLDAGAGKDDQADKDLALKNAAGAGNLEAVHSLIAYGANPNADLAKQTVIERSGSMVMASQGRGTILFYAARSGNPDVVRAFLQAHPDVNARGERGQTALFAAAESGNRDKAGAHAACVRLLIEAGANVNARDDNGNTPLHETYLTEVEEELLKLGADVNARNNDGNTPIATTVDNAAMLLFLEHGADLTLRNNNGQTMLEAANDKGPLRQEALRNAIAALKQR